MQFADLPLPAPVQASLRACGFHVPSPIQAKALPIALFGNDLIAQAKSGMGKTLVFATVAIDLVHRSSTSWAVMLAPTREIALQIQHVLQSLLAPIPSLDAAMVVACIGGLPIDTDEANLRRKTTRLVVGTPGRLKSLVQRKSLLADQVHLLVLDEVDKLLQPDFEADMRFILSALPRSKQTIACSATFTPDQLADLALQMHHPQFVCVRGPNVVTTEYVQADDTAAWRDREANAAPEVWLRGVQQRYVLLDGSRKGELHVVKQEQLTSLLTRQPFHQCIVFSNDKFRAETVAAALSTSGFPAECITSAHSQEQRTAAMDRFRAFAARILVSTDLTARGIDVDRVNLVINLELPRDPATYLHRVGRAGRFGGHISFPRTFFFLRTLTTAYGVAVTLLVSKELPAVEALAKLFKMKITELDPHSAVTHDVQDDDHEQGLYAHTDLPEELYQRNPTPLPPVLPLPPKDVVAVESIEVVTKPADRPRTRQVQAREHQAPKTSQDDEAVAVHVPCLGDGRANSNIGTKEDLAANASEEAAEKQLPWTPSPAYVDEEAQYEAWCRAFR
ncbi:hypothetical protein SPRG_09406 [Saprolegnia parasitica CBS 223.65]|uniref:Uncharacterized protein n=1 Tax=Saprolegnia parasitica (strain CBS 223.65) TaxID=695850 RepID=A0A067C4K3_SAPPC|nr:hypothetical protein SPRG_09406 [Saprolegnia parasitica CBS 223.65]KDO25463.1 hypothetical protein SPRG_09406 [Saprolegnia parasitica CBS 223.65]|eukprot:XP_012203888.1 hypothetical protein SPRG_09406 [Saprolegnia parasitica CBS 223.65]